MMTAVELVVVQILTALGKSAVGAEEISALIRGDKP
jgi:hypothetical protein